MILDFLLFWSATLTALRLGMKGVITADIAGVVLFGLAIVIGIARRFRSVIWRDTVRLPKFLMSVTLFGWSFSEGTWEGAIQAIAMSAAVPIALVGIYLIVRGPPAR